MYKFTKCKTQLENKFTLRVNPTAHVIHKFGDGGSPPIVLGSTISFICKGSDVKNVSLCDQEEDEASVVLLRTDQMYELIDGQQYKVVIDRTAIIEDGNYYTKLADDGSYDGESVMFYVDGKYVIVYINTNSSFSQVADNIRLRISTLDLNLLSDIIIDANRNRHSSSLMNTLITHNIIGTRAKTASYNMSSSNTLYEYSIKPKIAMGYFNTTNTLYELAKIYEYNMSSASDFTYNSGYTNQITNTPSVTSDIMTNNITVSIYPIGVNSITNISSNGSGGSALYNNGVYTISGNYTQVNSHLNSLNLTTTSTYDYYTNLYYDAIDLWTNKHIQQNQTLIASNRITDNPTYNSAYNRDKYINILPTMPTIIDSLGSNHTMEMYDFNYNKKVSTIFINNNDSSDYSLSATASGLTAGYFTKLSGDGKRAIQHSTLATSDIAIYRITSSHTWSLESTFTISSDTLEYERCDLDFYGNNAIIGNKLYTRASSGTTWSLSNTFSIDNNYYPINSIISQDGLVIFISAFDDISDSLRKIKRYVFRKINGSWSNVWTSFVDGSTTNGTRVKLGTSQVRLQNDLMSKDGNFIFLSTSNMHGIDSGVYPTGMIKTYVYNTNTNTYDFLYNIESSNTLPLFAPYSCSDDGTKLITRHAINPGSSYYLVSRLYIYNGSSFTYDNTLDFTINTSNDNLASISGDGNIIINTNEGSTTIKTFKYYNNTWNQLTNITGNSSRYAAPSISYNNNFILGNGNKEYYNTTNYAVIFFNNSINKLAITAQKSYFDDIKMNNKINFIIPYENRSTSIDYIFSTQTEYGTSYRNIQLNAV